MSAPSAACLSAFAAAVLGQTMVEPSLTLPWRGLCAAVAGLVAAALFHALESSRAQRASWHASRACSPSERSARISCVWGPASWVLGVWIALAEELHLRRAEALGR